MYSSFAVVLSESAQKTATPASGVGASPIRGAQAAIVLIAQQAAIVLIAQQA